MIIRELIKKGANDLKLNNIENYFNIARIILANILNVNKEYLIINDNEELNQDVIEQFNDYINKIIEGYPLQYITHNQEFMRLNFYVDENVLIPQPDTEVLVEEVLRICNDKFKNKEIKILDLCTGSGAIAIAIANNIKGAKVTATDISNEALEVADKNAKNNNVNIQIMQSNLFKNINGKFDIVVSNPPYIESNTIEFLPEDVKHEPKLALDGGVDGLDFYREIANNAFDYIEKGGYLVLEIGYNQKDSVIKILDESNKYKEISCIKDYSNNDRVIISKIK